MCWSFSLFCVKTRTFRAFLLPLTWVLGQPETTFTDLYLLLLLAVSSSVKLWFPFGLRELKSRQGAKVSLWWAERKEGVENKSSVSVYMLCLAKDSRVPLLSPSMLIICAILEIFPFWWFSRIPQFIADHVFSSQNKDFTSNSSRSCGCLFVFMATFPLQWAFHFASIWQSDFL